MWTAEALHVSELANFMGHMLTGPIVFLNYRARPGPGRPAHAGS